MIDLVCKVVLLSCCSLDEEDARELRARFDPGSERHVQIVDHSFETTGDGGEQENIGIIEFRELITEGPVGLPEVEMIFVRRRFETRRGEQSSGWDSNGELRSAPPAVGKVFGATLGRSLVVELDDDGKLDLIFGMEEMVDAIREDAGSSGMVDFLITEFTEEEAARSLFTPRSVLFPGRRVQVGDTWQARHQTPPLQGSLSKVYSCKLTGWDEEKDSVLAQVEFTAKARPGSADDSLSIVQVESLHSQGVARLDVNRGVLVFLDEETEMAFAQEQQDGEVVQRQSRIRREIRVSLK